MENFSIVRTKYGRGVISNVPFKEGDKVLIAPGIPINERDLSHNSLLRSYIFDDYKGGYILALGYGSLFNHDENPNLTYRPVNGTDIEFVAERNINPGDELFINYGYNPIQHGKELRMNSEQLNKLFSGELSPSQGGVELVRTTLYDVKEQLFSAPIEVKKAFNQIVEYFDKEGKGMCPDSGCIQPDPENPGKWIIISNKTGEPWKPRYDSEENAKKALEAYHANMH